MNPRNALRLARIFSLSAARAKRARGGEPGDLERNPVTNIYMSLAAFAMTAAFVYFVMGDKIEAATLEALASQLMVFLPAFTVFMSMVYSLMTEFSVSGETASTDMVNWLPVQAGDFVMGSALTTLYFVSPMVSLIFGISFGASALTGSLGIWALSAFLGALGCLLGALVLEMVRGAMNRISGAFSGARGQGGVLLRMILSVGVIVAFSMVFNFTMMMRVVTWFSDSIEGIRIIPLFWPSMIVLKHASGDQAGALLYSGLSGLLLLTVYHASVVVRRRFWAPTPVSMRLKSAKGSRPKGRSGFMGLPPLEAALIRKDLKSLLRRKEMSYLLAIPVMVILMGLVATPPGVLLDASVPFEDKTSFLYQCAMAVAVLVLQISLNAFGQEGEAFMNLVAAPVDASRMLRAKFAAAMMPALPVFALFAAFFSFLSGAGTTTITILTLMCVAILAAVSSVELALGARYANFSSVGRTRFVAQEGRLMGLLLGAVTIGVSASPLYLLYMRDYMGLPAAALLSLVLALVVTGGGFKAARGELERLYEYDY